MKVVVFGATGETGRHLTERALRAGHTVTAFARDPTRMPIVHERLRVVRGDVLDPPSVDRVIPGHDAVLSALGGTARNPAPVL
ncbi:MAG TPA: NAD(P)H-binding protein, partial [Thermoplasmata archaeon]|nr:NAD(P)H-binding protein [Thermoplasmata archaeon]